MQAIKIPNRFLSSLFSGKGVGQLKFQERLLHFKVGQKLSPTSLMSETFHDLFEDFAFLHKQAVNSGWSIMFDDL